MNQLINIVEEIKINASRSKPIILNGSRLDCMQAINASLSYNKILRAAVLPHMQIDAAMDILDIVEPLLEDGYDLVTTLNFCYMSLKLWNKKIR